MVNYWECQTRVDVMVAATITGGLWLLPSLGFQPIFVVVDLSELAKVWLGPVLTMLGMTAATTAFISTVIDRNEFRILRGSQAESQLWRIFAQNIGWLAASAIFASVAALTKTPTALPLYLIGSFLVAMLVICITKFAWVMRQVIFVRIDQAKVEQD